MSKVGAQYGQASAVYTDHSESIRRSQVRSQCHLARKSSKRVQGGEPNTVDGVLVLDSRGRDKAHSLHAQLHPIHTAAIREPFAQAPASSPL